MYKRTNIELDVDLVKKAMEITNINTIREVVHHSLIELIRLEKRRGILKFRGMVKWEGNLNELRTNE
ncbi:MAG: type II toxin-antitoxin system VapB family antitoxin [Bacteroidota bacterium]